MIDDQQFLTNELAAAAESGDLDALKLVLLDYHLAMLQTLESFVPTCTKDRERDLSLLKRRVAKLLQTTQNYVQTYALVPLPSIQKNVFDETKTLNADVGQLCPACGESIKQSITATFRRLRTH